MLILPEGREAAAEMRSLPQQARQRTPFAADDSEQLPSTALAGDRSRRTYENGTPSPSRLAALLSISVLHVGLLYVLLTYGPPVVRIKQAVVTMVTIASLDPPKIVDTVELPKPKPVREMPTTQQAVQTLSVPLTEVVEAAPPSRVELNTSSVPSTPLAVEARATTAAEPVRPPRFDADYLENPAPTYPALARRLGEQGNVILRVYVNPSGDAEQVLVASSSGVTRLDAAAIEAVRRWKFAPAKHGSVSVAAWVLVPINFSLKS